jgi:hydrogenase maturation protease
MGALVLGIGNTLRGDDGAAARVLALLEAGASPCQLTATAGLAPELAWDLTSHERVFFVDADLEARTVRLERVGETGGAALLGHDWSPARLVALARELGFEGEAWVCRLPVTTCDHGEGLSETAEASAQRAAALLREAAAVGRAV